MADPALNRASVPATYDDLCRMPGHLVAEILDGDLYTHPRPAPRPAVAFSNLTGELVGPFSKGRGGPGGWWIIGEPEVHLSGQVLVPDLAGWRRHRMPTLPDTAWFDLVPDCVCEILSPSTARTDRIVKMRIYAEQGIAHLWLLDPALQTLEVYGLADARWVLLSSHAGEEQVQAPPFEAVVIDLSGLWA
ncbi:MAG TPA: Uma2 family endonuclease [Lamprocystis sp. (in: g-proteobacteria)]|nr:Uma2 family endonuclease [Lamprocystis sp. (in: g-proteobacteria)]